VKMSLQTVPSCSADPKNDALPLTMLIMADPTKRLFVQGFSIIGVGTKHNTQIQRQVHWDIARN